MNSDKLRRYAQLASLLAKYGRQDFLAAINAELATDLEPLESATEAGRGPEDLVADLTELGPTFVKLGQMLSTRSDLLSQPYLDALATLQEDVASLDATLVEDILSEQLPARASAVFSRFDAEPMAAASLSQVHRAALRDGREVVVKVQRPGAREQVSRDLEILAEVAAAVDRHTDAGRKFEFSRLVDHFREALLDELDYRREANNLVVLGEELKDFDSIVIPAPVNDLVTETVLVMDYLAGTSVSSLGPLASMEADLSGLAESLCEAYLHQVLVAGFFQSDPHPGNILVLADGRLAIIDLGMVAHIESSLREQLMRLLLAICEGKGKEAGELAAELGEERAGADVDGFVGAVAETVTRRLTDSSPDRKLGRTLLRIVGIHAEHGIRPPPEVGLLGKTLLLLDEVAEQLDPDFDPDAVIGACSTKIMQRNLLGRLSPNQLASRLLDAGTAIESAPRYASTVLKSLARGDFGIRVDAFDEKNLLQSLERIGNRIALGVVLAALIIGAALIMGIETQITLFGYPVLAIVLFLGAVILGLMLVLQIMVGERRRRKKR